MMTIIAIRVDLVVAFELKTTKSTVPTTTPSGTSAALTTNMPCVGGIRRVGNSILPTMLREVSLRIPLYLPPTVSPVTSLMSCDFMIESLLIVTPPSRIFLEAL